MAKKVLVTYASRTGFTNGIAETIAKTLSESPLDVDLILMNDVDDLSTYQAVVAGSGIQAGAWLPEAMEFVQNNKQILRQKQFAAFLVCMTLAMKNGDKYRSHVKEWMQPVRVLVPTISENIFAGGLDIKKVPEAGDRLKFRLSNFFGVWKEGDHRDWNAIQSWSKELAGIFMQKEFITK
jgi:menaquinone-dependent protoporphyrinogen oxidase